MSFADRALIENICAAVNSLTDSYRCVTVTVTVLDKGKKEAPSTQAGTKMFQSDFGLP